MQEKLLLCVDDDACFLRMITSYLEAFGYAVVAETNGHKALQIFQNHNFHAAVLDCVLPDLGNGELAIEINRLNSTTPIIILTGSRGAVPASVAAIAKAVLSKETGVEALITAIERVPASLLPRAIRKFPRYPLELSFVLRVLRSDRAIDLHGTTTSMAEGGLGGRLDGEVFQGEDVVIEFLDPRLGSISPQAQVRHRAGDIYGFEFLSLDADQRATLRESFQLLAAN